MGLFSRPVCLLHGGRFSILPHLVAPTPALNRVRSAGSAFWVPQRVSKCVNDGNDLRLGQEAQNTCLEYLSVSSNNGIGGLAWKTTDPAVRPFSFSHAEFRVLYPKLSHECLSSSQSCAWFWSPRVRGGRKRSPFRLQPATPAETLPRQCTAAGSQAAAASFLQQSDDPSSNEPSAPDPPSHHDWIFIVSIPSILLFYR